MRYGPPHRPTMSYRKTATSDIDLANAGDVTAARRLLHGAERRVWRDAGYQGVGKRPENNGGAVDWRVALKPGKRRALAPDSAAAACERARASVRAKVEHPFLYLKRRFGCARVRYRGLAKNRQRIRASAGLHQPDDRRAPSGAGVRRKRPIRAVRKPPGGLENHRRDIETGGSEPQWRFPKSHRASGILPPHNQAA